MVTGCLLSAFLNCLFLSGLFFCGDTFFLIDGKCSLHIEVL